jgi:hypothetical protein
LGDCLLWAAFLEMEHWPNFFSLSEIYVLILAKNVMGASLGKFFTNSSGRPA